MEARAIYVSVGTFSAKYGDFNVFSIRYLGDISGIAIIYFDLRGI